MPINIPNDLPAKKILESENIFVMTKNRAETQDIRPLKILLVNLMPTKMETETQFSRLLGNTALQINLDLLAPKSHISTMRLFTRVLMKSKIRNTMAVSLLVLQ